MAKLSIIKPSDKGGRIVVMSKKFYKSKVLELLDTSDYQIIEPPFTEIYLLDKIIEKIREIQDRIENPKWKNKVKKIIYQTQLNDRIGLFYGLPKVHKNHINPPMRPVVSQTNHPTAPLARVIDKIIQKYLYKKNPHILTSTDHALKELKKFKGKDFKFISLDVKSLYTSIPLNEGISSLQVLATLSWRASVDERRILSLIDTVLFNNFFEFEGIQRKQLKGVAMGSPLGPAFANVFMLSIDKEILRIEGVVKYYRYIDNILIICDRTLKGENLLATANNLNQSIKFELVDDGPITDF